MPSILVGLDFGTKQTKVCINHDIDSNIMEFHKFNNGTYFLPSKVVVLENEKLNYGDDIRDLRLVKKELLYFKMASAEDEEFHLQTNMKSYQYKFSEFDVYSPEFLSVIYLAYVLIHVRTSLNVETEEAINSFLFDSTTNTTSDLIITCGIPTEWSYERSIKRRIKFESILYMAYYLQKEYDNLDDYLDLTLQTLIDKTSTLLTEVKKLGKEKFSKRLNEFGQVFPETAAGLTFMLNSRMLGNGWYASMDIGAGTTDISFFGILNNKIIYIGSESYQIGANSIFLDYASKVDSAEILESVEELARHQFSKDDFYENRNDDEKIYKAVNTFHEDCVRSIRKLFYRRVRFFGDAKNKMTEEYKEQPIILYGGGSLIPYLTSDIEVWKSSDYTFPSTYMEKSLIKSFTENVNFKSSPSNMEQDFPLLTVALGLAYVHVKDEVNWINDVSYIKRDKGKAEEIPHPFNEDCYIYDVLVRKYHS